MLPPWRAWRKHISANVSLYGGDVGIYMKDYSGISGKSSVYAISDDFSGGDYIANATVPSENRRIIEKKVILPKKFLFHTFIQ